MLSMDRPVSYTGYESLDKALMVLDLPFLMENII